MIWPHCCVLENFRLPPGECTPNCLFFIYYYYYYFIIIIIIIISKLWDWPPLFLCVFLIWPPPRDLSIARLLSEKWPYEPISLLLMIWRQFYVLKNSSSPLGGAFFAPKNVKIPPMIVIFKSCQILLKICTLSNLMVLNSFLMLFWPKTVFVTPLGGF